VRCFDVAQNTTTAANIFYVLKDTTTPQIVDNQSGDDNWRSLSGTVYDVKFYDINLRIDPVEKAIGEVEKSGKRVVALVINSPNNPTGAVFSRCELVSIAKLAVENDFWVVSDEIYDRLVYEGGNVSIASLEKEAPDIYERTLTINGPSKSDGVTGIRIGYGAGPKQLIDRMSSWQSHSTSNASSIAQFMALAALDTPEEEYVELNKKFKARRGLALKLLSEIPLLSCHEPKGAFYLWVNCSHLFGKKAPDGKIFLTPSDVAYFLLDHAKVGVVPGEDFGSKTHFRLSYACSGEKLSEAMARIKKAVAALA